jgi:hypothetical protein
MVVSGFDSAAMVRSAGQAAREAGKAVSACLSIAKGAAYRARRRSRNDDFERSLRNHAAGGAAWLAGLI